MAGILKKFKQGEVIIAEGTTGKALYIIRSGRVEVSKQARGGVVQLAVLGPNEVFGEMSLIDDRYSTRTATVRALQDSELIILDRQGFEAYIGQASPGSSTWSASSPSGCAKPPTCSPAPARPRRRSRSPRRRPRGSPTTSSPSRSRTRWSSTCCRKNSSRARS